MIRLVRANLALMDAALAGDDVLAQALAVEVSPGEGAHGVEVVPGWATFTGALRNTRASLAEHPEGVSWGTRLFVTEDPPELVGWGGFKGAPVDGVVEVGYEIAEARQGRGLATEAVRAMLAEAFASPAVDTVLAHTLPERNASTRVLEKSRFTWSGEVEDRGETAWRFALTRVDAGAVSP